MTISRWENGATTPGRFYRKRLSEFFGIDIRSLGFSMEEKNTAEVNASSQNIPPLNWNVPYQKNPFFTGREKILSHLHEVLMAKKTSALTQPQALHGLGGIGKTQIALEYAYRYYQDYHTVLWARAHSSESLTSDYTAIAVLLNLPERNLTEQRLVVEAVKRWLAQKTRWLLILDNADDLQMVSAFIPSPCHGHVLLTTRLQVLGKVASSFRIEKLTTEEATLMLLRRTGILDQDGSLERVSPSIRSQATDICQMLDNLPLAVNQAGAYLEETRCGLDGYLRLYRTHRRKLLEWREAHPTDYPYSVATTWSLSFEQIEQTHAAAAELLRFFAFLAPDAIPEELLLQGASEFGPALQSISSDAFQLNEAIKTLLKYSLLRRNQEAGTLSMHRLVQAVLKDQMDQSKQRLWADRTVHVMNKVFPEAQFSTWDLCQLYLPQAQLCADLIEQFRLASSEAGRLLDLTGNYLLQRGRYHDAARFLRKGLAIREQVLEPEHPAIATSLNHLARLYLNQGKYDQVEAIIQRALTIQEKALGSEHPDTATSLHNLGNLYQVQEKFEQAESVLQRAHAIRKKATVPDYFEIAAILDDLSVLYADQGTFETAIQYAREALEIRKIVLGADDPDIAISLGNMAGFYHAEGKLDLAEPLYQQALSIFYKTLGTEYAFNAELLDNLACLYIDQGKYELAEPSAQRALDISEKALGLNHSKVAQNLKTLATIHHAQGKNESAEQLLLRALAIYEQTLGPEHSYTAGCLTYLALFYTDQKKYEQAERFAQRGLEIKEKALSPGHHSIATNLNNLAEIYLAQGKYEQAEAFCQRGLAIRERAFESGHPDTATSLHTLANIYVATGKYAQAELLLRQALTMRKQILGTNHPDVAKTLKDLAD